MVKVMGLYTETDKEIIIRNPIPIRGKLPEKLEKLISLCNSILDDSEVMDFIYFHSETTREFEETKYCLLHLATLRTWLKDFEIIRIPKY
jgi:hypothetical protein